MEINRTKITELLWDKAFRDYFSDLAVDMKKYLSFPNCSSCLETLYSKLIARKENLETYFGESVTFTDNIEKQTETTTTKALANVPVQYRRGTSDKAPRPIRRFLKVLEPEEVNDEMSQYVPSRYRVEAMTNLNGKLAIMMIEIGTKEKARVATQEGMDTALAALEKIQEILGEEAESAEEYIKVLKGVLASNYSPSGQVGTARSSSE